MSAYGINRTISPFTWLFSGETLPGEGAALEYADGQHIQTCLTADADGTVIAGNYDPDGAVSAARATSPNEQPIRQTIGGIDRFLFSGTITEGDGLCTTGNADGSWAASGSNIHAIALENSADVDTPYIRGRWVAQIQ